MRRATVGKLLGLAGLAGVAATGAVLARDERQRRAYTPDDIRARLHERHAAVEEQPAQEESPTVLVPRPGTRRGRLTQGFRNQLRHLPHRSAVNPPPVGGRPPRP